MIEVTWKSTTLQFRGAARVDATPERSFQSIVQEARAAGASSDARGLRP